MRSVLAFTQASRCRPRKAQARTASKPPSGRDVSCSRRALHGRSAEGFDPPTALFRAGSRAFDHAHASFAAEARNVLVLYSNGRLVPANVDVEMGLHDSIVSAGDGPSNLHEFLDLPEFVGPGYEGTMTRYLREKYASHPPAVVVVVAKDALDFTLRHRQELFPAYPSCMPRCSPPSRAHGVRYPRT